MPGYLRGPNDTPRLLVWGRFFLAYIALSILVTQKMMIGCDKGFGNKKEEMSIRDAFYHHVLLHIPIYLMLAALREF